jgi:hypothetical protein
MRLIKQNTIHNTLRTAQYHIILISQCCSYLARSQNCEKQLLGSLRVSVRLEIGFHLTYFREKYLSIFLKSVEKIRIQLISDNKNNGTLHEGRNMYIYNHTSLNFS